jgi:hypothetical protein
MNWPERAQLPYPVLRINPELGKAHLLFYEICANNRLIMTDSQQPSTPDQDQNEPQTIFESLLPLELPAPDFHQLQDEYYRLWSQIVITSAKLNEIDGYVNRIN